MRFSRGHYEATEISGQMKVEIILIRGISTVPVGVTVMLRSGSATGILNYTLCTISSKCNNLMFCYLKTLTTLAALKLLCYHDSKPIPHNKILF